jgi:leucine dehydrogenase
VQIDEVARPGYHRVIIARDPAAKYIGVIAVYSIARGPALGGTRFRQYTGEPAALRDALRLARGMTLKSAFARLPFGGGKAVVIEPEPPFDRDALFEAHGRAVDLVGGEYITAEDVGTSPADLDRIRRTTRHVVPIGPQSIDSAWATSRSVLRAIQGAAEHVWGGPELEAKRIVVQGCGATGARLTRSLLDRGARVSVADVASERVETCRALGATPIDARTAIGEPWDVLAPCALGGVFDRYTTRRVSSRIIAGSANDQLTRPRLADRLAARGVVFVPDFVANAGEVIAACPDLLGWSRADAVERIDAIRGEVLSLLRDAVDRRRSPYAIARERAVRLTQEAALSR